MSLGSKAMFSVQATTYTSLRSHRYTQVHTGTKQSGTLQVCTKDPPVIKDKPAGGRRRRRRRKERG